MGSRDIKDLTENMQAIFSRFKHDMTENGLPFIVTCTSRIMHEQIALYMQGRHPVLYVNEFRKLANLSPISPTQNKIVTWTINSKHLVKVPQDKSKAFDIALKIPEGSIHWNLKANVNSNDIPDYEEAGRIGESVGLKWGGRFKKPDYVHFEEA